MKKFIPFATFLLLTAVYAFAEAPANSDVVTPEEIKATQAAVKKQGPRVPNDTYHKVVPAYLTKSGELTSQGKTILGDGSDTATPAPSPKTESATKRPPSLDGNETPYGKLIGKWRTGPSATAHTYEFKSNGDVTRYFHVYSGSESANTKYAGVKTEEFHAENKDGKIVVSPKGKSDPQEWFEIAIPFNPAAPAAVFYRVRNGERSETPFTFIAAAPLPERDAGPTGTVQRTIAKTAIVMGPEKRRYLTQGAPVEVAQDRANLPEWASEIVFKGRGREPDERWLFPTDLLTEGEPYQKPSLGFNPVFPPSRKLESQYLEVTEPHVILGPNGRNFVLMPGTKLRAVKRAETGEEYGKVPGIEVRDRDGLSTVLPESAFKDRASGFAPLPPPAKASLAGLGTEQSPYLIRSQQDFLAFCQDPSKWEAGVHSRLERDIDLSGVEYDDPLVAPLDRDDGLPPDKKPAFNGVLDGNKKKIIGLRISTNRPYANAALFQQIGPEGIVRNLSVENAIIETKGLNSGAAILCFSNKGLIKNCRATGKVTTSSGLGSAGLCAENRETGNIIGSFVGGDGKTTVSGWQAGGLCSLNEGLIERSGANAEIRGDQSGGLISANQRGTLRNCLAAGKIVDSASIGGLSTTNSGLIENCFSRTQLTPSETNKNSASGGLVGRSSGEDAKVTSSYWNTESSGITQSQGGIGITTAQSKEQNAFPGWNFNTVWKIGENGPELRNAAPSQD